MDVDLNLVRAVQRGDPGAMEALIEATYVDVYRLSLRLLGNPADAADATQDVFLRVMRSVVAFRADSSFGTWLHRITVNVAATMLSKQGTARRRGQSPGYDAFAAPGGSDVVAADDDIESDVLAAALHAELVAAIDGLPDPDREIVLLRDVRGFSTKHAAELLGISESAAKVRLHRAHAKLRERLARKEGRAATVGERS